MPLDVDQFIEQFPMPPTVALCNGRALLIDPEEGRVRLAYEPGLEICNPAGVIQGGFLTVMLDDAMGLAAFAAHGFADHPPTLEFKVSFLKPVFPGPLEVEALVLRAGREIAFVEGKLHDRDGKLAATASATVSYVRVER